MAVPDVNTEDGRKEYISKLGPDFQGLLERKEIAEMTQAKLGQANCKSLNRFASLADVEDLCAGHAAGGSGHGSHGSSRIGGRMGGGEGAHGSAAQSRS